MKFVVYINGNPKAVFVGFSEEAVENFIRENDSWNRQCNGWNCKLDDYEVVRVRL